MRVYKGNYCSFLFSWIFECTDKIVTGVHLARIKITLTKMIILSAGYFRVIHLSNAIVAQLAAHDLAKVRVAGSNPVYRS